MRINESVPMSLAPPWQSGRYYFCPNTTSTTTLSTSGNATMRAVPFFVPNPVTLSKIGAEVTGAGEAGSKVRLGIYTDDGTGRPGSLVVDAGQIDGTSATVQELTISTTIGQGWYWAACVCQSAPTTQPTLRASANASHGVLIAYAASIPSTGSTVNGYLLAGVTGVLPASWSSVSALGSAPRIFVKVS